MPRLILGLDFGTTFSGEIEVISTWPKSGNKQETPGKVPTTLAYQENRTLWGYQTASLHPDTVFHGFKLLLDPSQHDQYQPAIRSQSLLKKYDKTAVDVAGDYLKCLVAHAKTVLQRRLGAAFECMELHYVLTVPAVWSDKAKDATRVAGVKAGIPVSDITMISEPDAAAMYCLDTLQPEAIKDLISYRVSRLYPLVLKEETQGTAEGGICGSACLDSRFDELLQEHLGETYAEIPSISLDTARSYWDNDIKPSFGTRLYDDFDDNDGSDVTAKDESEDDDGDGATVVPYIVPLPGVQDDQAIFLKNNFLYLDWNQIQEIFDPVVDDVERLVRGQVESVAKNGKTPKVTILLVGGFGSSEYLFRKLKKAFPNILVMQPPNAWTAVVRGAVSHGIGSNPVSERIARRHYGIRVSIHYDPSRHHESTRYWDSLREEWMVTDAMAWYIKKGSAISEDSPISLTWSSNFLVDRESKGTQISLYVDHQDDAPGFLSSKDTFKVCTVDVDLGQIPSKLFERKTNSQGKSYYKVKYDIRMTPKSATILFELVFNGATYGSLQAKY
ncbi:actin-like ATPase domain-containing protein [Aspergillus campestris IBT 28561]|uniref:Actin-like ATPase domain-containing protein n=1 Tax=Aspergillus campestris (strain IBT 28561) TaxID=1392248 RepID=A0A2I1D5N5_ASPC2|nr:actin-like ATPase domain-containing protein [Aspergillus campestris IBT 28561]PKY05178.1 actin-like ATPase domain-containing protein [Aspergillus campestris IBT 28561]